MSELNPLPVVVERVQNPPAGHTASGRFAVGNKLGRGSPLAGRAMRLRAALLKTVTPRDIQEIAAAMLREAKAGDISACKELLDRTLGKPGNFELMERLESLERRLAAKTGR